MPMRVSIVKKNNNLLRCNNIQIRIGQNIGRANSFFRNQINKNKPVQLGKNH